jgi:hypothetical protein
MSSTPSEYIFPPVSEYDDIFADIAPIDLGDLFWDRECDAFTSFIDDDNLSSTEEFWLVPKIPEQYISTVYASSFEAEEPPRKKTKGIYSAASVPELHSVDCHQHNALSITCPSTPKSLFIDLSNCPMPELSTPQESEHRLANINIPVEQTDADRKVPLISKRRGGRKRSFDSKTTIRGAHGCDQELLQCQGMNLKKKSRCRNAALLEFIGPQPIYCAEHIYLDPSALYHKCGFVSYDKEFKAQVCTTNNKQQQQQQKTPNTYIPFMNLPQFYFLIGRNVSL